MSFLRYLLRRLAFLVLVIIGTTLITFFITNKVPGDPVLVNLGQSAMSNPEIVAAYKARHGLDKPLPQQYLTYVRNLVQGDLGKSIRTNRPVADDLAQYLPASFELATVSTLFAVVFGIGAGVASVYWRARWPDSVVRALSMFGVSVPNFWLALVALYIFYFKLGWLPGPGRVDTGFSVPDGSGVLLWDSLVRGDWALFKNVFGHLLLPAAVLGAHTTGVIARTTRSSMLEVMAQDYMRTARAKGLGPRALLLRHALMNALIPTITVIGLSYGNLLGGTVLVETIFAWPGIGRYAYQSTTTLDFPAIMGVTLVITLAYVLINLIVDLAYGLLDPRVRYQ